jgi:hypothetical protein
VFEISLSQRRQLDKLAATMAQQAQLTLLACAVYKDDSLDDELEQDRSKAEEDKKQKNPCARVRDQSGLEAGALEEI